MKMTKYKYWIFDLDGTITIPKHNFVEIKQSLGIPIDRDIISFILEQSIEKQNSLNYELDLIEKEIAKKTEFQSGVSRLIELLYKRNYNLGIITRNTKENALISLDKSKFLSYFKDDDILGRESFAAKPSPEAIHFLLNKWNGNADKACIIGDYFYDLQSGKNADIDTIHFNTNNGETWPKITDYTISSFSELIEML